MSQTNPALEREALYAKSQVYIKRGFRAQAENDTEEYQLWASLALELLGKAALAKIHPALIADPQDFASLFAACGRHISPDLKTITAFTLFQRLGHVDKGFDSRYQMFCKQLAIRRNAELHSGESPFSGMSAEAWEREFWGAVEVVLKMQEETLESWLGLETSKAPTKIIEQTEEAVKWAVKNRICRCAEDFEKQHQNPAERDRIRTESQSLRRWGFSRQFHVIADAYDEVGCPACEAKAFLAGIEWDQKVALDPDDEDQITELVETTYATEEFFCPTCSLHLFGTKELEAAELPEDFSMLEAREREYEADYGNE